MFERLDEETKRRNHVLQNFANGQSWLRLIRSLAVETRENGSRPTAISTWMT
jgi:putative transposase